MLMAEGNKARKVRGYSPTETILYKAYGIFQYDLQYVENDRAFFENKRWYNIDDCVDHLKKELVSKYKVTKDVRKAIKAYNGSGSAAEQYVNDVFDFIHKMVNWDFRS
jgi:outer membrane phospholipase A